MSAERLLYMRLDGKWAWHLKVNGNIVATDGGQGYENEDDARAVADHVISGHYKDARKKIRRPEK